MAVDFFTTREKLSGKSCKNKYRVRV